ncbi:MAG: electron transfer flavoprotein subunit alpha/FixB family protein, partial [Ignavibacteria bacterium]|nr:electron transfer flavoprotein subunit alpha/FixB family protein [Ignavibacteria bacterium]
MLERNKEVWIFVEQRSGKPADVSFELLSKGRKLAASINGVLKSVVIGHNVQELAKETFRYGAVEALVIDHPDLLHYRTMPYSRILNELVDAHKPAVVLFGATIIGRDLAPRVASHTKSGLTADCTELQISDVKYIKTDYKDLLLQIRPAFGGNIIATIISPDVATQMATVREGVMRLEPLETTAEGKITSVEYIPHALDEIITIVEQHREENKVNLKAAPIIVAGG